MYLIEILEQKKIIDQKIDELKTILLSDSNPDDGLAQRLINLLDLKQGKLMNINSANNQSKIKVGSTELSVANAVIIRDTIKEKIDLISQLILSKDCGLDKASLIDQRDKYFEEHMLINTCIIKSDTIVNLG